MKQWEVVIGIETHVQLSTQSKIFSGSSTAFGAEPNVQANAVDLAKANPAIAKQLGPAMEKLREAFGHIPLDKLPQPMR